MTQVAFRADASLAIGAGHVMRCLSLADGLRGAGARVRFVCRADEGHLGETIVSRGFEVDLLATAGSADDAAQTARMLAGADLDWVVVDHYASDQTWDVELGRVAERVMVIDDLADRPRGCQLLLNQNSSDADALYAGLLPSSCRVLAGPRYALLRAQFAEARQRLSDRRPADPVRRVLVSLGGMDAGNVTTAVLRALRRANLPSEARIIVLLGPTAPWAEAVREAAAELPWPVEIRVGATDMAALLLEADLAIGAAGSSSWERCAVGLPSVMIVVADNQRAPALTLQRAGAAVVLMAEELDSRLAEVVTMLAHDPAARAGLSSASAALVDGQGVRRVVQAMMGAA